MNKDWKTQLSNRIQNFSKTSTSAQVAFNKSYTNSRVFAALVLSLSLTKNQHQVIVNVTTILFSEVNADLSRQEWHGEKCDSTLQSNALTELSYVWYWA